MQAAFGTPGRLFVVVTLTADAGVQTPSAFEVLHVTESSSTGRDASTPTVPLRLEALADTGTGVIDTALSTASCHAPFELELTGFEVSGAVVCEAGTVLTATEVTVTAAGDLTLRAGERIVLSTDFSVGTGGVLTTETDDGLLPP